jgi:hypothetical protein
MLMLEVMLSNAVAATAGGPYWWFRNVRYSTQSAGCIWHHPCTVLLCNLISIQVYGQ